MEQTMFDDFFTLMSKYKYKMETKSLNEDLLCVICKEIMIDAYQGICGCRYCLKCINEYLSGENTHCPGEKEECKDEKLVYGMTYLRNNFINKKISKVKVYCPNESCQFTDEIIKMNDHLKICPKQISECPYVRLGCHYKEHRDIIRTHLNDNTWEHTNVLIKYVENIKEDSQVKVKNMIIEQGKMMETFSFNIKEIKEQLQEKEIQIIQLIDEGKKFKEELRNKDKKIEKQKRKLVDTVFDGNINRENMMRIINEMKDESNLRERQITEKIQELKREEINHLVEDLKIKEIKIAEQNREIETLFNNVNEIKEKVEETKREVENQKREMTMMKNDENIQREHMMISINEIKEDSNLREIQIIEKIKELKVIEIKKLQEDLQRNKEKLEEQLTTLNKEIKDVKENLMKLKDDVETFKKKSSERNVKLEEQLTTVKKEIKDIKEQSIKIKDYLETLKKDFIERDDTTKKNVTQSVEDSKKRDDSLTERIDTLYLRTNVIAGEIMFRVERFSERSLSGERILSREWVYSPYFYSHFNGYKLRLKVWPRELFGGDYFEVYFVICKGEHDDELPWPCNQSITVSVVNEREGLDRWREAIFDHSSATDKRAFERPKNKDGDYCGGPLRVPLGGLRRVLLNDVVLIRGRVSAAP